MYKELENFLRFTSKSKLTDNYSNLSPTRWKEYKKSK